MLNAECPAFVWVSELVSVCHIMRDAALHDQVNPVVKVLFCLVRPSSTPSFNDSWLIWTSQSMFTCWFSETVGGRPLQAGKKTTPSDGATKQTWSLNWTNNTMSISCFFCSCCLGSTRMTWSAPVCTQSSNSKQCKTIEEWHVQRNALDREGAQHDSHPNCEQRLVHNR